MFCCGTDRVLCIGDSLGIPLFKFSVTRVRWHQRPTYGKRISSLNMVLTTTTQCLPVLSSIIMLRSVFLPINANRCGPMTCTTNYRVLRELFMIILPVVLWQNSYKRIILKCNHCQWCFHTKERITTTIENYALNGIKYASHLVLVVEHAHNFV